MGRLVLRTFRGALGYRLVRKSRQMGGSKLVVSVNAGPAPTDVQEARLSPESGQESKSLGGFALAFTDPPAVP